MTLTPRHGLALCAASAALVLYACASLAQPTAAAGAGAQAIAIVGGASSGDTQRVHTTPDAIAPGIIPSAPCIAVYSGGASVTGFGIAIGGGQTDQVCQGGNLAAVAAGVFQATGSEFAADVADIALERALTIYLDESQPDGEKAVTVADQSDTR